MNVELIILSFNNFETTTLRCLESISDSSLEKISITVVDNLSTDGSRDKLVAYCEDKPHIKLLLNEFNSGYAGGMNFGAKKSNADWIVLVDSDAIFFRDSLKKMYETLGNTKKDIVSFITNSAGTAQEIVKTDDVEISAKIACDVHTNETNLEISLSRVDFFCVAITKCCWRELDGLDEIYGMGYYEDLDFCERAKEHGYRIVMSEDVFVGHGGSTSFKKTSKQKELIANNKKIYSDRFPKAKLLHTRDDNLVALKAYAFFIENSQFTSHAISHRLRLRLKRAHENMPRSPIKKIRYKLRLHEIERELKKLIKL